MSYSFEITNPAPHLATGVRFGDEGEAAGFATGCGHWLLRELKRAGAQGNPPDDPCTAYDEATGEPIGCSPTFLVMTREECRRAAEGLRRLVAEGRSYSDAEHAALDDARFREDCRAHGVEYMPVTWAEPLSLDRTSLATWLAEFCERAADHGEGLSVAR